MVIRGQIVRMACVMLLGVILLWQQGYSQNHSLLLDSLFSGRPYKAIELFGYLEQSLPVELIVGQENQYLEGYVYYGNNKDRYDLQGEIDDEGIATLYEFDRYNRVTGKIVGKLNSNNNYLQWNSTDQSLTLFIHLITATADPPRVYALNSKQENEISHIYLRPLLQQWSYCQSSSPLLRWQEYDCQISDCYEVSSQETISNPLEFSLELAKDNLQVFLHPSQSFNNSESLSLSLKSMHRYGQYVSAISLHFDEEVFTRWQQKNLDKYMPRSIKSNEEYEPLSARFQKRMTTDFYITLLSKDLVSGFYYVQNSDSHITITVPFIYNYNKAEFYNIHDLFDKDFNYAFFINSYIEKVKRGRLIKENKLVQGLLKNVEYRHHLLTPAGILFMTDFHVIYGRRSILIPYEDVVSSLENKALENYIKKERR